MEIFVVCVVALLASALTLFSGFGLGTLLMPAFALLFPVEVAIAATAVVHLANNLFKLALLGRHAVAGVVLRFGLPAAVTAFGGALVLRALSDLPPLGSWQAAGRSFEISPVGLVVGILVLAFAVLEGVPAVESRLELGRRSLALGGALSGFFGGLSGHQGALRSAFLIRAGLGKEGFIATGIACAVMVDVSRLVAYGLDLLGAHLETVRQAGGAAPLVAATVAAFAGAFIGQRLLAKVTMTGVRWTVGVLLGIVGVGLAAGVL